MRALVDDVTRGGLPAGLEFGPPVAAARDRLAALTDQALGAGRPVRDAHAAAAVRAGLWWAFDYIDESHTIAQDLDDAHGAYWHGLVHRREPDPGNARYWFARVAAHPIWDELGADARELVTDTPSLRPIAAAGAFRPDAMVKLCGSGLPADARERLLAVQRREWELLLDHDWTAAFGE
jgi:hypothetical protein